MSSTLNEIEKLCLEKMISVYKEHIDPSHDISHVKRVVKLAKELGQAEKGQMEIIIPAAYLHDCVFIDKSDPRRSQSSRISAVEAIRFLKSHSYPEKFLEGIQHAVEAHSFSAQIPATTLEAKIVQDADRLDAIGAIGIARAFSLGGRKNRFFYSERDPFCRERAPQDADFTLDHFFQKLLKLGDQLHTLTAKRLAEGRTEFMRSFLRQLEKEV